jgi:hypothetical protein
MNVMNTGICKKIILVLTTCFTLSACAEDPSLNLMEIANKILPRSKSMAPLYKAQMASGAITLVAPSGYCIEPSSLTKKFAAMARCDFFEAKDGAVGEPIVLLTASVAKSKNRAVSLGDIMNATNITKIKTITKSGPDVVLATTEMPPLGLPKAHLRILAQINDHDMSLALFSSLESIAQGERGAVILQKVIKTSHDATIAQDVTVQTSSVEVEPDK